MTSLGQAPCDEGVLRTAPARPGGTDRNKPWVLATTILGSAMAFIDGSVVNVGIPVIQAELSTTFSAVQWVVNGYMLMLGALILVGGAAGDEFGRRRVFNLGVALFTAASVACGLAPNAEMLIATRVLQGVGGALLVPGSLAIISAVFPKAERGRAIGTWAGFSALTTAFGPVLGGWLVDTFSWRAIFFLNVPLALIVLSLSVWRVPESRGGAAGTGVDWVGGALSTLGLAGLAYGLTALSDRHWTDPVVLVPLFGGVVVLALFLRWEAHAKAPMMPLGLFRSPSFSGANGMTLMLYMAMSGAMFFIPFNLIRIEGYSPTQAGAAFLPFTLVIGGLSRWSGGLIDRYGARTPLIVGPAITSIGFVLFAVPGIGGSYWTTVFPAMLVLGFGMAVGVAPLTTTVMGAVENRYAGIASGINNAVARVGGMLSVALLGAVAVGVFGAALEKRVAGQPLAPDVRRALEAEVPKLGEAKVPPSVQGDERWLLEQALDDSFVHSFRVVMVIAAGLALASGMVAAATIGPRRQAAGTPKFRTPPVRAPE